MGTIISRCLNAGVTKNHTSPQSVAPQKPAEDKDQFEKVPMIARPQVPIKILDVAPEDFSTLSTMSSSASVWDSDSDC